MIMNELTPCNTGVLLHFYDKNPYRGLAKTTSGIITDVGREERYKSNDTGEIEQSEEFIACAKVIAIGPKCENVQIGEDVFCYRRSCIPVPYENKSYYILAEQNIVCRVTDGK